MKNVLITIGKLYLLLAALCFVVGCDDDKEDVAPGLYVASEEIETFPGDTVLVSGTASNYTGLESVTLSCENWGIHKVYDLKGQKPKVFNYDYRLIVPKNATFEDHLLITIRDVNGWETKKNVLLAYIADMTSPVMQTQLPERISVDFNTTTNKGSWNLNVKFTDDRELKSIRMQIPDIQMDETVEVSGRSGELKRTIDFTTGEFPVTLTLSDAGGNETIVRTTIVVMLAEEEDPIQDYAQMYVVNAGENPDDYVNGYYRYMDRKDAYQYEGKFYASTDNTEIYFVPAKSMEGDLYGTSPYVSSKLMNKNGYVVPVILPKKGYYGIWIDLNAHTYSIWEYEIPSGSYTGALCVSGTGFTIGDWGAPAENMKKVDNDYRYEYDMELVDGYSGDYQYYFYSPDWAHVFRADTAGNWWFESATGSCVIYKTDYAGKVKVTFDTAAPWGTIKKITE